VAGHPRGQLHQIAHGAALGDDQVSAAADPQAGAEGLDLATEALALLRLAEGHDHFVGLIGSLEVVIGPFAHRGEGHLFAAGTTQHENRGGHTFGAEPAKQSETIGAGQLDAAEDEVELLGGGARDGPLGVCFRFDGVAGFPEQQGERVPGTGVVLNDQQPHRSSAMS